jgi:DNA-binding protein HU-beta
VNEISLKTGTERKEVLQIVEGFMESVKASLINGENVYLRGFGSFILKHRAEKVARNINKNTSVVIPAHDVPHFKPSKDFSLD